MCDTKLTDAEIEKFMQRTVFCADSFVRGKFIRKLLAERVANKAEVKRLRGMMAALLNASPDSKEWGQALDAIGWYMSDTEEGKGE